MTRAAPLLNRFLVNSEYSVFCRKLRNFSLALAPISDYTLLTARSGRVEYSAGDSRGQLNESQVLLLNPNTPLELSGTNVAVLQLTVSSAILTQHAISMRLVPAKSTVAFSADPITNDRELFQLLSKLYDELLSDEAGSKIVMRALVEQLLVQLLRRHSIPKRSDELELSRVGLIDRRIRRSIELMHSQSDQDLSLKDMAAASYLSTFHFARLFKKITGVTPHNYFAAIRAQKAQRLLAENELSINAIAARVGYLSSSHFTKAFRAATGTSPKEFRKALTQQSIDDK